MDAELSKQPASTGSSAAPAAKAVHVNGELRETVATTLAELIAEAGYGEARVATAVNGTFVPARARSATTVAPGDHVEIVAPRQGG